MRPCQGRSRGFESRFPLHLFSFSPGQGRRRRPGRALRLPPSSRAPSPSGKAEVCKTSISGSNPDGASNFQLRSMGPLWIPHLAARSRSFGHGSRVLASRRPSGARLRPQALLRCRSLLLNFARWGPFGFPISLRARGRSATAHVFWPHDVPPALACGRRRSGGNPQDLVANLEAAFGAGRALDECLPAHDERVTLTGWLRLACLRHASRKCTRSCQVPGLLLKRIRGIICFKSSMAKHSQSTEKSILDRIRGHGRGWVFTPRHFLDLASRPAITSALRRQTEAGTIRPARPWPVRLPEAAPDSWPALSHARGPREGHGRT